MAKSSGLKNAPSSTGNLSGGGRANNPEKPEKLAKGNSKGSSSSGSKKK